MSFEDEERVATYRNIDGEPVSLDRLCREEPAWAANRLRVADANLIKLRAASRALQRCADSLSGCIAEFCDTGIEKTCACKACGEHMQALDDAAERLRVVLEEIGQ